MVTTKSNRSLVTGQKVKFRRGQAHLPDPETIHSALHKKSPMPSPASTDYGVRVTLITRSVLINTVALAR